MEENLPAVLRAMVVETLEFVTPTPMVTVGK
jgi:hypothetical protein